MSGSALAQRFTEVVGEPPMRYLAMWRMQVAQQLLSTTDQGIARIAARVGYRAQSSFHRAFKRYVGEAPGAWRERVRAPG
jgi:AraC-like DNA-binding protein